MKFESFAVTSKGNPDEVNTGNYYLNGVFKSDALGKESFDTNISFGKKDVYAVADGSFSDVSGEEAAFWGVNILGDFADNDFKKTYEDFFVAVNTEIAGKIFENDGKRERLDMAVLYINRRKAIAYNVGKSCIYVFNGNEIKKLTGRCPDKILYETQYRNENKEIIIEKEEKETVKILGMNPEKYVVFPSVSDVVKISSKSSFLLCNSAVAENAGEEKIAGILKDKKKSIDAKVSEIIDLSLSKDGSSEADVVLIERKRGFVFSWFKVKLILIILALAAVITGIIYSYESISTGWNKFLYKYVWDDKIIESIEVEPWVPKNNPGEDQNEVVPPPEPEETSEEEIEEKPAEDGAATNIKPKPVINKPRKETPAPVQQNDGGGSEKTEIPPAVVTEPEKTEEHHPKVEQPITETVPESGSETILPLDRN